MTLFAGKYRIDTAGHRNFRWQSLYWDRIVRNQDELNRIRAYIADNPRKWSQRYR